LTDETELKAETDDRVTPLTVQLVNVDEKLEAHVNFVIDSARKKIRGPVDTAAPWTDEQKEALLREVYDNTGAYRKGTGIFIGVRALGAGKEVSLHPEVVFWIEHFLQPEKNEIAKVTFRQTRFGKNNIHPIFGKVISHKTMLAANHSIAKVIRVKDVLLGSDKWGHFFMQGYWYHHAKLKNKRERHEYGQYMEGDSDLREERRRKYSKLAREWVSDFRFGYFGAWSTGVISLADGQANEGGFQFYTKLFNDPEGYRFDLDDYMEFIPQMNEQTNPSKFASGIDVSDVPHANFPMNEEFKRVHDLLMSGNYQGGFLEADRLFKITQPVKDYYLADQYENFLELRKAAFYYGKVCDEPDGDFEALQPTFEFRKKHQLPEVPKCQ
jgi:hypothetical protein